MRGSQWLDAMQQLEGDFLHNAWETVYGRGALLPRDRFSAKGDQAIAALLAPFAALFGCERLTGEVVGKARLRHGLAKFRRGATGVAPEAPGPKPGEQQLPLASPASEAAPE